MFRKSFFLLLALALSLVVVVPVYANPGKPSFEPEFYADGKLWGTKGAAGLPAPNENNVQSFDKLFVIINGAAGQKPVAEAAPGNPKYNGGRWFTQTVMWTEAGFDAHGTVPVLTSYDEVMLHYSLGHLSITAGSPGGQGAPPEFFECPLLPVK